MVLSMEHLFDVDLPPHSSGVGASRLGLFIRA